MPAAIRVFLLTYRRPALLPRALASLRAQTFTNWVCELHNDAPDDDSPRQLLDTLDDPRITLHQHQKNWGAVTSFNHAFAAGPEPYASLLEDDNWWEPTFLATAHAALEASPAANVTWANMHIALEHSDGTWSNTGRTTWSALPDDSTPRLFHWPQPLQFSDALHSNGAMLYRAAASRQALVPANLPLAIIEPARERLLAGGWLLLPQPLAHFALTLRTARSKDRAEWMRAQLIVAASYLASVPTSSTDIAELWGRLRAQTPPSTSLLFHLALAGVRPSALLRHARPIEWFRFLASAVLHPVILLRSLRFRSAHPMAWRALVDGARARSHETPSPRQSPLIHEKKIPDSSPTAPQNPVTHRRP